MEEKKAVKISLFLHKQSVVTFKDCLKSKVLDSSDVHTIREAIGLQGEIYVHHTQRNIPEWKHQLNTLSLTEVQVEENTSNKAVVIFKYNNRFFSMTYGYGRSMLNESTIVRNFGLIVAANLIDSEKLKSSNSMTIEDAIVDTQKQASDYTNQSQLQVNKFSEILKSISGAPKNETTAKFLIGTDSLTATKKMDIKNIKSDIAFYYSAYQRDDYKKNGFEWLDNVQVVKDSSLKELLENTLEDAINQNNSNLLIAPNKIIDWENIHGFYLTGTNKRKHDANIDINYQDYFEHIRKTKVKNIISKLKRDSLKACNDNSEDFKISNVYDAIIYETIYNDSKYLLCYGDWYEIDQMFFEQIKNKVNNIPIADFILPPCRHKEHEDKYNKRITNLFGHLLLDQKNYQPREYGRSKIEPCDILTKKEQFIHIKKGGSSSQLSHLFAQGLVSAKVIRSDSGLQNHINIISQKELNINLLKQKKSNYDYEIIFGIIDQRSGPISNLLPFFSMVNLSQVVDELIRMNFKVYILRIKQETESSIKKYSLKRKTSLEKV